ncbi:hypothetical protein HYV88_02100 [Candidatus Woesearchaeota archaeon]|nr:hypothetical protein [Candidatus Woesearchaeota archaeon]
MKRGIFIIFIILILNPIVLAVNLNNPDELTEKDLIESCRVPSSGPELVLQKSIQGDILIWLYEPNKEEFGDLVRVTDFGKINENRYSFKLGNNQEYTFEAIIPDYCIRPKETTAKRENTQTKEVCGSPETPRSIFMEGRGYACLYDIPSTEIQPEQAIFSTGILPQPCPQEYCVTISESTSQPVITNTPEPTSQPESTPQMDSRALANDINKALPKIAYFIRNFFNSILGVKGCTREPTQTPPLNPPISTTTTTEEKCNEELGDFDGRVERIIKTNIHKDISFFPDYNNNFQTKMIIELNLPKTKNSKDPLCGLPRGTTTMNFRAEGPSFEFAGGYNNAAGAARNAVLNFLNKHFKKFYENIVKKGIVGNGGILIDQDKKDTYYFKGFDREKTAYAFFEKNKPEGYFYFDINIKFTIKDNSKVEVDVNERVTEDKAQNKILLQNNANFEITVQEFKDYLKDIIDMINSLDKFEEKYQIVLEESVPDVEDYVNGGSSDPIKMKTVKNTKVTVTIIETLYRKELDEYEEKTKCCKE